MLQKADRYYRQGHPRRAIWTYKKVLRQQPNNIAALVNLGLIYSTRRGKHAKARQMLGQALQIEPENVTILFNLATLTAQTGDFAKAQEFLEQVERLNSDYPDLHYNKAYLFAHQQRWEEAKQEVERELQLNPGNVNAIAMKEALQQPTAQSDATEQPTD